LNEALRLRHEAEPIDSQRRVTTAVLLTLSATSLALALQVDDGSFHPAAIAGLGLALACLLRGLFGAPVPAVERWGPEAIDHGLGLAFAASMTAHLLRFPVTSFPAAWPLRLPVYVGLFAAALLVAKAFAEPERWQHRRLAVLVALFALVGVWIIVNAPSPEIDVFVILRDSAAALLHGRNPYAITFPNIYGNATPYYGAGVAMGGRLNCGFVYPPLILLLSLPGYLLGDVRYAHLAAMAATAAFIAGARPGRRGFLAAALYLFAPRGLFVLDRAWTDPFVLLMLAAVIYCVCRAHRALPVALGLLFASKQYLILAVPAFPLVCPSTWQRNPKRTVAWAALVAAAVSLPLALWDLGAFWHSVVNFQAHQPFRDDALSFLAAFAAITGVRLPSAVGFVAAGLVMAWAQRRCPRTPAGFCALLALTFMTFFAFNKQAFCNYYHFVFGILCLALATLPRHASSPAVLATFAPARAASPHGRWAPGLAAARGVARVPFAAQTTAEDQSPQGL
jgi:hypothetical protein